MTKGSVVIVSEMPGIGQENRMGEGNTALKFGTRVFELYRERYESLPELAKAMGISVSQIYRVLHGQRHINEKFITGTIKAFPGYTLDSLFCVVSAGKQYGTGKQE